MTSQTSTPRFRPVTSVFVSSKFSDLKPERPALPAEVFSKLGRAQEIAPRCNILILLGNRYGWRPLPEEISGTEFQALESATAQVSTTTDELHSQFNARKVVELIPSLVAQSKSSMKAVHDLK